MKSLLKDFLSASKTVGSRYAIELLSSKYDLSAGEMEARVKEEIEKEIGLKFYQSIVAQLEKDNVNVGKIGVTDITLPCLRRAFYQKKYGEAGMTLKDCLTVWIGRQCHETPVLDLHELELSAKFGDVEVFGRIDEYGSSLIIEKKTTRKIPKEPHEHHIEQLKYYKCLLEKNGYPVHAGAIIYIDVNSAEMRCFPVLFGEDSREVEKRMVEKARELKSYIEKDELPPRTVSWECEHPYCRFMFYCMLDRK